MIKLPRIKSRKVVFKKTHVLLLSVLLIALLAFSGCATQTQASSSAGTPTATTTTSVQPSSSSVSSLADIESTLENVYTQVNPSIVNVSVVQKQDVSTQTLPSNPGFPGFNSPQSGQGSQQYYSQGLGSGFVWDKNGDIITNNHVVAGADRITVTFQDGTTVEGKVIGSDSDSDLAVIKVNVSADKLQPVQIADSDQVKVGQLAAAIGNPYGLQGTMTVGFISALGRLLPVGTTSADGSTYSIPDVIQTDAPINPGNSGGVLVNKDGQVIGVTAAIESESGSNAGIGFVIPSNIVQKVVPVLIKSGHYDHPWLGISALSLDPDIATAMNLTSDQRGALVVDITPGGPADNAGLQGSDHEITIDGSQVRIGGDVITKIDGQPVLTSDDLVTYLARSTDVGQSITLTVLRNGKEQEIKVTLGTRPQSTQTQQTQTQDQTSGQAWLGIWGLTVDSNVAGAMGLSSDQTGVLVEQIQQGSPADKAGLNGSDEPVTVNGQQILIGGDIIVSFNNHPIDSLSTLQALLQTKSPGDTVTLGVLRSGKTVSIQVALGQVPTQ